MYNIIKAFLLGWVLLAALSPAFAEPLTRDMTVRVSKDLSYVEVTVNPGVGKLEAHSETVWETLQVMDNGRLRRSQLTPIDANKPVIYRVELSHNSREWAIAQWHDNLRLGDWNHWLLTPVSWTMATPFTLTVHVPNKGNVALPFQPVSIAPGEAQFKAYPLLPDHGGIFAFGEMQQKRFRIGGKSITAAVVGKQDSQTADLFKWIEAVVNVAGDVHGTAPGDDAHVVIIPVPFLSGLVPWAHVRRGGGSHIIAYVKAGANYAELLEDWTLFHEMTHLYHPYLRASGRWISEGFASYYQNVYRSQAGVVTPSYAYGRLMAGIDRGRHENEEEGFQRVTQGGRMRTYWTAAAMALQADAKIRELSDGQVTLAEVMGRFAEKQLPSKTAWHPRHYIAALDEEFGRAVLLPLYDQTLSDRLMPVPATSEEQISEIFGSR